MARLMLALLLLACAFNSPAREYTQQEMDDWFNAPPDPSAADVNEGELVFLTRQPAKLVHHHHNVLTLSDQTVVDGWGELRQCHENLDRVPATQIVFREDRVRKLRILSSHGIEKAWVEGATVQLKQVGPNAKICVALESHVLYPQPDGTYHISNGPFMRKFLDGYYPMHVSMEVIVKSKKLRFHDITPNQQEGFKVSVKPKQVLFDAWFEGRLNTLIRFKTAPLS
ncbi:MAG: hypothetical protein AABY73_08820 [Pseudomonadota bacterium]